MHLILKLFLFFKIPHISSTISGLAVGQTCTNSKECTSQNCIKVCSPNSNLLVCGAAKWKLQKPNKIFTSTCYDTTLGKTQYSIDTNERSSINLSKLQELPISTPTSSGLVGQTCTNSNECISKNCIKVCSPNSTEQMCGADKWKHQRPKGIFSSICYDTAFGRTKYSINTKAYSGIRALRKLQESLHLKLDHEIIKDEKMPAVFHMDEKDDFYYVRKQQEGIDEFPTTKVTWSNVVIYVLTFNSELPNRLLEAHFNTWIKSIDDEGLDIVIVTDSDDKRSYDEIVPDARSVKPKIHVHKSPAEKEGTLTRAKVVDSMSHIYDKFIKEPNPKTDKQYFLKVDSDTVLLQENLIPHLQKVYNITHPLPVDFGKVNCFAKEVADICYTTGGFYGMNKRGFEAAYLYILEHPGIYSEHIENDRNGENLIAHEDFFISYAFRKATGYPATRVFGIGETTITNGPHEIIGIHKATPEEKYYQIYNTIYNQRESFSSTL